MAAFVSFLLASVAALQLARAHTVITYPGWRGNNLNRTGPLPQDDASVLGIDYANGSATFPYGMQWMYPCGGMAQTTNRSSWPVGGGALSVQPGWFEETSQAFMYINIGITQKGDQAPRNYSHQVVPPFQITGPNSTQYNGQFCLPQVRMPAGVSLNVGDNITIQVVQAASFGSALYSCSDVTLRDPTDPSIVEVTPQNCYNSSDIHFNLVFTSASLTSAGTRISELHWTLFPCLTAALSALAVFFVL